MLYDGASEGLERYGAIFNLFQCVEGDYKVRHQSVLRKHLTA